MTLHVNLLKYDTRDTIVKNLYDVYHITKQHKKQSELVYDDVEAERLYKEYYSYDNPLQEYNHFIIEVHGFSRDFLSHISRDTKFLRMWSGSARVTPIGVNFVKSNQYYTPDSILTSDKLSLYKSTMDKIEELISECALAGFTTEELKHVTPASVTLPITLSGSFRAIRDMCEKRACIGCQSHWHQFIQLLSQEIASKIDPWLAGMLYRPKCMQNRACFVKMEQDARTRKWPNGRWKDSFEICPLYIRFERKSEMEELERISNEKHPNRSNVVNQYFKFIKSGEV